jgi:hypothetical protein
VDHDVGNVEIKMLTDFGRILQSFNKVQPQTVRDPSSIGYIGLVIDQDNYNHISGAENIADSFGSWPYASTDDFQTVNPISMVIDDGTTEKSIASFQNEGSGTGDPFDILVNQTVWTYVNSDWAIIQYTLTNVKSPASVLTGVCLGLEIPFSKEGARYGVGGALLDGGDDVDGYDSINNTYWVTDLDSGVTFGVGSAIISDPITHYYSEDYHADYASEYKDFFSNETWLYDRLHNSNATATDGINPGNVTTTLGWNGETILAGSSRTFTIVIAINDTYDNMMIAISDAQNYYRTVATGFHITEFSDFDSPSQKIEIYNSGNQPTDLVSDGYFLSNDGGLSSLTGNWDKNPLPTYEYGVFTLSAGSIGPEGDTIGLYRDLGGGNIVLMTKISYGQEGVAPDPLSGESTARRFDIPSSSYTNEWLRNSSGGSTWGAENNVLGVEIAPDLILNEVMFNPQSPELGFVEIMYTGSSSIDIQGYKIVCDGEYEILPSLILNPSNPYFTLQQIDDPVFFSLMDPSGDNVYLYDNSGKLLDMVGWNSPHNPKMSASRVPDGNGTYQGYNDGSSQAAGWVFNTPLDVIITEISDSGSPTPKIEVYNPWYPPIDFSSGFSFESQSGPLAGVWSQPVAPTNGYAVFDVSTPLGLNLEGDFVRLFQSGFLIEEISYGQLGAIPDPLALESVGRIWDIPSSSYTNSWSRNGSAGPTWGSLNLIPPINLASEIVLNEVMFNPGMPNLGFIELIYNGAGTLDIQGYKIICDDQYIIPSGNILYQSDRYYVFIQADNPAFFTNMDAAGDNIYLYDNLGRLLDMVGWSSSHTQNNSMVRVPEGFGGHQGYDDVSSPIEGWVFNQNPSPYLLRIAPDQFQIGIQGMTLSYILDITNRNIFDDIIDINYSSLRGWSVELLQSDGITPLMDTESGPATDGIPDTGIVSPLATVQIAVNVTIPFGIPGGVVEFTDIMATSSINPMAKDTAQLNTSTLMGLEYRSPNRYVTFVRGTLMVIGHLDNTQVKITDVATGSILNQFMINSGATWTTTLFDAHVDINATNNVTVLSGEAVYASGGNSWMSYIPTESGGKAGRLFHGFVPLEMFIFAPRLGSLPPTLISIVDESDGDDSQTLTSINCDYVNSDIEIYKLTGFDDDVIKIASNVPISIMTGKISTGLDWTVTPPSVNGSELGKHFFVFASDSLTVLPLEDNTTVTVNDLSDGDDSRILTMNRNDIYTQRSLSEFGNPIVTRPGVTLYHNSNNLIDDDYMEIIADKDVLVYIGPICDQRQEFADLSPSVSTGIFSQEVYTYAQNGGANDLQVFVYDKEHTVIQITSLTYSWGPGSGRDTFFDFTLDADDFSGVGPWWWEWGGWGGNILHIQSNLPISVFNGDFDGASFGSFLSVINPPKNLQYPDLKIDSTDVSFDPGSVINIGGSVKIKATVHNIGDLNVSNIKVSFYNGDPLLGGILISGNQTLPYLDVGENVTINTTWLPPFTGLYTIFITIDYPSPGTIVEFDETNNIAFKILVVQKVEPPDLYITSFGDNIILNWTVSDTTGLSHYLIYRSTSQIDFNFSSPWVRTDMDSDNGIIPFRSMWNDTNSASELAEKEYYYTIRAVFNSGEISQSTRTVGKYTKIFPQGISTFSLPLEPLTTRNTEFYSQDMNASYIKWIDPINHTWVQHDKGSLINNTQITLGKGYEIEFTLQTKYTFCGLPGAMILYDDVSMGFKTDSSFEAQSLSATVNSFSSTIVLNWQQPANIGTMDKFHVLRSNERDGFWGTLGISYIELAVLPYNSLSYLDSGNASQGTEYYYMIVPINSSTGEWGSGSYSVGVWTSANILGYDTFGFPLKIKNSFTADWYCDEIQNSVGINYFNITFQRWNWHATSMPEGAFDPQIEFTLGYQISVSSSTKYSFIGI